MFHSNWKDVEGVIYSFANFQREFIFSVYLKVKILEGEHVALHGRNLVYIFLANIQNDFIFNVYFIFFL